MKRTYTPLTVPLEDAEQRIIFQWAAKDAKEDAERKQSATSRPNRQRDLCSSRAYSEAELDRMGHDLLGGD